MLAGNMQLCLAPLRLGDCERKILLFFVVRATRAHVLGLSHAEALCFGQDTGWGSIHRHERNIRSIQYVLHTHKEEEAPPASPEIGCCSRGFPNGSIRSALDPGPECPNDGCRQVVPMADPMEIRYRPAPSVLGWPPAPPAPSPAPGAPPPWP